MQWSIWSKRVEKDNQLYATIHSNKVWRNINFRYNRFHSQPSKHLEFVSCQRHHIKWRRIAFQISMHWYCPNPTYQQASSSVTPLGIVHWIPKRLNTIDHNSLALEQCNTNWSTILALLLHIQHRFITRTCLFLILSTVKICTKAAVHKKNSTLDGTLGLQILLQGKHTLPCGFEIRFNLRPPLFRRGSTQFILFSASHLNRVNIVQERLYWLQPPILNNSNKVPILVIMSSPHYWCIPLLFFDK